MSASVRSADAFQKHQEKQARHDQGSQSRPLPRQSQTRAARFWCNDKQTNPGHSQRLLLVLTPGQLQPDLEPF